MENELAFAQRIWAFQLNRMNFGFVRHTLMTIDGIEHVKITYFILF